MTEEPYHFHCSHVGESSVQRKCNECYFREIQGQLDVMKELIEKFDEVLKKNK